MPKMDKNMVLLPMNVELLTAVIRTIHIQGTIHKLLFGENKVLDWSH
ncbi:hypothetical protein [Paenibacillus sp. PastM-3]|nr:hypothetical protein [Paenibacillus sp. PastM-3]